MPRLILLQPKSQKITFLALAPLYFSMRHPGAIIRMPLKTLRMLFGSGVTKPTIQAMMRLRWLNSEGQGLPVFRAVTPNGDAKPTEFVVEFEPELISYSKNIRSECLFANQFFGINDVSRLAYEYGERELLWEFEQWAPRGLERMFQTQVLATQTPEGSSIPRHIIYCPLCRHTVVGLFYGTVEELHKHWAYKQSKAEKIIFGDASMPEPRPRWVCTGCGLKLWSKSDLWSTPAI